VRTDNGRASASLSVEERVRGIVDYMMEKRASTGSDGFVDYRGREMSG